MSSVVDQKENKNELKKLLLNRYFIYTNFLELLSDYSLNSAKKQAYILKANIAKEIFTMLKHDLGKEEKIKWWTDQYNLDIIPWDIFIVEVNKIDKLRSFCFFMEEIQINDNDEGI
ncbi:MAG: hypothetical protein JXJ04_18740 [Spirochaetales bacterium]|nr:hypothetical protein [Spirochaetales bacterium]